MQLRVTTVLTNPGRRPIYLEEDERLELSQALRPVQFSKLLTYHSPNLPINVYPGALPIKLLDHAAKRGIEPS